MRPFFAVQFSKEIFERNFSKEWLRICQRFDMFAESATLDMSKVFSAAEPQNLDKRRFYWLECPYVK